MMYRQIAVTVLAAMLVILAGVTQAHAEEPLNLLFYGNSFSANHNVPWMVIQIAKSGGHPESSYVLQFERGVNLDYHIDELAAHPENSVSHSSITGDTWDYVVIQGYTTAHEGDPSVFRNNAQTLYTNVRDHTSGYGAGVTGILYETWARPKDVPSEYATMSALQAEIATNYHQACSEINAAQGAGSCRVATAGEAFETMDFDSSLYIDDGVHSTRKGSVLAAMMIYRTIYDGEYVSDISYDDCASWQWWLMEDGITEDVWGELAAAADATPVEIPEPASIALLGTGALMMIRRRRR